MSDAADTDTETEHLSGYQDRDWRIVDYRMYVHEPSGMSFRGPPPSFEPGRYITCLGAAQTLGCFCERPFPALLAKALGVEAVNFGYGGAGPRFYLRHPALIEAANRGQLAVVQVMSGRSEDNSRFRSGGLEYLEDRRTGERLSADEAYRRLLAEHAPAGLPAPLARALRLVHGPASVRSLLAETRAAWVESYRALFARIEVPIVLLWFSKRRPGLHRSGRAVWWWQRYDNVHAMFGKFPQLVDPAMMRAIEGDVARTVTCVTDRGSPQPLFDRFTGEPTTIDTTDDRPDLADVWTHNAYYPSPEMHEDAAALLAPVCRALLNRGGADRGVAG